MQQVNFKHCWIDSASARYEQEYMISFIISQKSVMPDRILRRYLLSSTSPAAASVRLLISTAPLSTLFYSLHSFATYVNPFMRILNFYTFCPLRHWLPLFGREGARPSTQTDPRHDRPAYRPRAPLHKTNRQKDLVAVSRDPGAKNAKLFSEN